MSTRGFIGFAIDSTVKAAYNHSDSYPDGLGHQMLDWLRGADLEKAAQSARNLRVVDPRSEPTDADIAALKDFYDPNVGGRRERPDWYQLLRRTQGEPQLMLQAGVIEDASTFPADSLFAEWGYVVDFDAQVFEVYQGFQQSPHTEGRFAAMAPEGNGYFPVRLAASWPLKALPTDEEFDAKFSDDGE